MGAEAAIRPKRLRNQTRIVFLLMVVAFILIFQTLVWIKWRPEFDGDFTIIAPHPVVSPGAPAYVRVQKSIAHFLGVQQKMPMTWRPSNGPLTTEPLALLEPCAQVTGKRLALHKDLPRFVRLMDTHTLKDQDFVRMVQETLDKDDVLFLKYSASLTLVVPKSLAVQYPHLEKVDLAEN